MADLDINDLRIIGPYKYQGQSQKVTVGRSHMTALLSKNSKKPNVLEWLSFISSWIILSNKQLKVFVQRDCVGRDTILGSRITFDIRLDKLFKTCRTWIQFFFLVLCKELGRWYNKQVWWWCRYRRICWSALATAPSCKL